MALNLKARFNKLKGKAMTAKQKIALKAAQAASAAKRKGKRALGKAESKGGRVGHSFEVGGGHAYDHKMTFPFAFPATSDLDVVASAVRTNNSRITAAFDILLVEN